MPSACGGRPRRDRRALLSLILLGPVEGSPGSRSDRNIPSSEGVVVRFSYRMVPEVYQVFWAGMAAGEFINDAAIAAGSYRKQGSR